MVQAGILDGDLVIAEKTPVARNGEIVVAMIEDEATVKTSIKKTVISVSSPRTIPMSR